MDFECHAAVLRLRSGFARLGVLPRRRGAAGQPSFQQYQWSDEKKAKLQALVEKIHAQWTIDRDYMAPPSRGKLVRLDPALLVTPPKGFKVGYVPIVVRQEAAPR
jgi:hypothetical protein